MRVQWENNADIQFDSFTAIQLNVGDDGVSYHVDSPWLITNDHIYHPIVAFNTIRPIAKESSGVNFLNKLFEKAFNNTDISNIEAFVVLFSLKNKRK